MINFAEDMNYTQGVYNEVRSLSKFSNETDTKLSMSSSIRTLTSRLLTSKVFIVVSCVLGVVGVILTVRATMVSLYAQDTTTRLETDNVKLVEKVESLNGDLDAAKWEAYALTESNKELVARVSELENQKNQPSENEKKLAEENETLAADYEELEAKNIRLKQDNEGLTTEVVQLQQQNEELAGINGQLQRQLQDMSVKDTSVMNSTGSSR